MPRYLEDDHYRKSDPIRQVLPRTEDAVKSYKTSTILLEVGLCHSNNCDRVRNAVN